MPELLFDTRGSGLGDSICQEPTFRYATRELYPKERIHLVTKFPEVFQHLDLAVHDEIPAGKFNCVSASPYRVDPAGSVVEHPILGFTQMLFIHMVDFFSLFLIRRMLSDHYRRPKIQLPPVDLPFDGEYVAVHVSANDRHRSLHPMYAESLVHSLVEWGHQVVVFGRDSRDLDLSGALDLINVLDVHTTCELVRKARLLITTDSAPVHIAAAFDTPMVVIPTIRHPDFLLHARNGSRYWKARACYKKLMVDDRDFPLGKPLGFNWFPPIEDVMDYYPEIPDVLAAAKDLL